MTTHERSASESGNAHPRLWIRWVLVTTILGGVVGAALAARVTPIYKSETLIELISQHAPETFIPATFTLDDRLRLISPQILSRARLERLIREFDLYAEERQREILEEIFDRMRENVAMTLVPSESGDAAAVRIAFTGTDPRTVVRVTDRLAQMFILEYVRDGELLADSAYQFVTVELQDVRRRFVQRTKELRVAREQRRPEAVTLAIEHEVLETRFKDLSAQAEEARLGKEVAARAMGARWQIIHSAHRPDRPISPDWGRYLGMGGGAGATLGVLALLVRPARPNRKRLTDAGDDAPGPGESVASST